MELPSKELLESVLDSRLERNCIFNENTNDIVYAKISEFSGSEICDLNIYELMHLMKEWIRSRGYEIQIKLIERDGNVFIEFVDWRDGDSKFGEDVFKGRTEWEAMVVFAEWILKESK